MPMQLSYIAQENRLDLRFEGNLDLTVSNGICDLCKSIPLNLNCCIIDVTEVARVFDSGLALLQKLYRRCVEIGTTVVILTDHPRIRALFPAVTRAPLYPAPRPRRAGTERFARSSGYSE
jgi:ABC-type transporter Mla MlaB component